MLRKVLVDGVRKTYNLGKALDGSKILKEVRIGDLARSPNTLVFGVVNPGSKPFALVIGIGLQGAERI